MKTEELLEQFRRITPDDGYCNQFVSLADEQEIDDIEHLGLVLVAPETFALGVTSALCDKIKESGFHPVDLAVADALTEEEVAAMFIPGWIPERYRFWLIQRRFMMGPTAAILVTHHGSEPIGDLLQRAKGYRIPIKAVAGTWRGDLPSINGVMNLVHTADAAPYVLRNGAPFFPPERLVMALRRVAAIRSGRAQPLGWEDIKHYALAGYARGDTRCGSFFQVYFRSLARLLARQWARARHPHLEEALGSINALVGSRGHEDLLGGTGATLRAIQATSRCEHLCEPPAGTLIRLLTHLHRAHLVRWDRVLPEFAAAQVTLDRWETLILFSTLYYTDQELSAELLDACRETLS